MFLVRRPVTSQQDAARLQNEMSRVLDGFFGPVGCWPAVAHRPAGWPKLDVSETDSTVVVVAELPGVKQEEIDIEVQTDVLRISGEKKDERVVNEQNYHATERSFGRFDRTVNLPAEVNGQQAEATFQDGVLSISLPKVKATGAQKVTIKSVS